MIYNTDCLEILKTIGSETIDWKGKGNGVSEKVKV